MSQQPGPGQFVLSWSNVLDGIYAGLLVAASGITALDPGTISHPTQQIIVLLIAVASAILARIAGIQANQQLVSALEAENAALKGSGATSAAPVAPEPAPQPVKVTVTYSDGTTSEHDVPPAP